MKKLVVTMLTVLTCGAAYALPVGNPSEASLMTDGLFWEGQCTDMCDPCASWCDAFSLRAGFYGDYVFNRHMEIDDDDNDTSGADIEHTQIFTNAGYIALNAWDRADIFTSLGVTNLCLDTNLSAFSTIGTVGPRIEIESQSEFSWSVGGRISLWECGCTTLGIEGQYFRTRPDIKRISVGALTSEYPDDSAKMRYSEWQVGLGLSHRINMLVPYVAVKWAQSKLDFSHDDLFFDGTVDLVDLENSQDWGYAVGVSLVDCEKASVTVEGRFAAEKALYVNGQFRF